MDLSSIMASVDSEIFGVWFLYYFQIALHH